MATDDDPPFKVEQRDRDGNRIERVIGRAENLIVGRVLCSLKTLPRVAVHDRLLVSLSSFIAAYPCGAVHKCKDPTIAVGRLCAATEWSGWVLARQYFGGLRPCARRRVARLHPRRLSLSTDILHWPGY